MPEGRRLSPEEWAEMFEWLRPRAAAPGEGGPQSRAVTAEHYARLVLRRYDAEHLTEFLEPRLIAELKAFSQGNPGAFRRNLEKLVRRRLGLVEAAG